MKVCIFGRQRTDLTEIMMSKLNLTGLVQGHSVKRVERSFKKGENGDN